MLLVQTIGAAFWSFLYRPPLMDCRVMRSCLRAASSNSYSRPFHRSHRTNLLHTTWPVSSRRTSYRMPPGFWVVRIMAYPFGSDAKITVGNGALKMETPPQAVLYLRGRLNSCCAFGCTRGVPRRFWFTSVHYCLSPSQACQASDSTSLFPSIGVDPIAHFLQSLCEMGKGL